MSSMRLCAAGSFSVCPRSRKRKRTKRSFEKSVLSTEVQTRSTGASIRSSCLLWKSKRGRKSSSSIVEFDIAQELVVARWRRLHVLDTLGVDDHVVHVPEIQVRQIAREYLLHACVVELALGLVDRGTRRREQRVQLWIRVVASIGSARRHARRIESIAEDVGILIAAAHPSQRVELIRALGDVGV